MENSSASLACALVRLTGEDALDLLNRLSTNDLGTLAEGGCAETLLTTSQGKMIDWVRVLHLGSSLMLVTSPERGQRVASWLEDYTIMEDSSAAVVAESAPVTRWLGPQSQAWADDAGVSSERSAPWGDGVAVGAPKAFGGGVDFIAFGAGAGPVAEATAGAKTLARDEYERFRVAAGIPSPDAEFEKEVNPLELRLEGHAISFSKGCYIGQEVLSRMDSYNKVARRLIGFESDSAFEPTPETRIVKDGKAIGKITSLITGETTIGLAIVNESAAAPQSVVIQTGEASVEAQLVDRPFWSSP
ncbi:MAG: glycine cleavage T C-terminal barrel domain-containing protein [Myxococcota bacterium]